MFCVFKTLLFCISMHSFGKRKALAEGYSDTHQKSLFSTAQGLLSVGATVWQF